MVSEKLKGAGQNLLVGALVIGGSILLIGYLNKKFNIIGKFVQGAGAIGSGIGQGVGLGLANIPIGIGQGGANVLSTATDQFNMFAHPDWYTDNGCYSSANPNFGKGESSICGRVNRASGQLPQLNPPPSGPPNTPPTAPALPPIPPYIPQAAGQIYNIISKTGATLTAQQVTQNTSVSQLAKGLQTRPPTIFQQSLFTAGNLFTGTLTTRITGSRMITGSKALFERLSRNLTI